MGSRFSKGDNPYGKRVNNWAMRLKLFRSFSDLMLIGLTHGFWTAIIATLLLSLLGGLAGLAPAWRAMSIKPVDAMRDE